MADFDSSKNYKWETNAEFKMNGEEFGLILNTFRTLLNTPEAQKTLMTKNASDKLENVLKNAVENGQAQEAVTPTKNVPTLQPITK
jgi:hypothetical protein